MDVDKTSQTNDLLNYYLTMNINNICRVCLEKGKLLPIFDPIKPAHFSVFLMSCAQVQVEAGDGLPPYICQKCVVKLNIAFQFKVQCESSDARLRSCFNNIQQIPPGDIHISGTEYVSDMKTDSEISNSSISITFTTHNGSMGGNTLQIQNIQEVNNIDDTIAMQGTLQTEPVDNPFNTLEQKESPICDLAKVTLTELKLDFEGHKMNNSLKVSEKNLDVGNGELVKSMKPKKMENHQCGTCGKIFKTKPSLVHHIRIHTGERPYVCHLCDKRFINGGHLHTHMKWHTGEKNHVCAACHKAFTTAQQLTKHTIAIHTSERPYSCTYCTKKFASSSNLRTHVRIHTGEKNFRCDQCGKAFCTKGQLEQHMLTHTGERAFLCEYCNKRFSQKCHLLRHLKTHRLPTNSIVWKKISREFETLWNFPHCIGALDGKHVVLQAPINSGSEFFNYKSNFSIVLFALVDANYNFMFADIGCQGRISDGGVFKASKIHSMLTKNTLGLPLPEELPGRSMPVPYFIAGDGAFPLDKNLMKPYSGNYAKGTPQRVFNYRLSRARRVVENAFGITSSVFRVLRKPMLLEPEKAELIVMCVILLHNYLRTNSPNLYIPQGTSDYYQNGILVEGSWRNNEEMTSMLPLRHIPRKSNPDCKQIRDEIAEYCVHEGVLPWQNQYA